MVGVAFRDSGLHLRDLLALARAADDCGYESIWVPEVGSRDAVVLASLYGSVTKDATVGTGVIPMHSRSITSLALSVAAAAEATDGRFILGLGAGHRFTSEAWYGAKWEKPRAYLREMVDVLCQILRGERVTHDGRFNLSGFHLDAKPPAVPIYLAALTPGTLRLAGQIADGVILNWLPPEGIEKAALLAREAAVDAGRTIEVIAYVRTAVTDGEDTEHAARVALREQTHAYLSLPAYANSVRRVGFGKELDGMAGGAERAIDTLADALCARGDELKVKTKLRDYREAGADSVIVYPVPFGEDPAASVLHTLRNAV